MNHLFDRDTLNRRATKRDVKNASEAVLDELAKFVNLIQKGFCAMSEQSQQLRNELKAALENIGSDLTLLQTKLDEMAVKANAEEDAAWKALVDEAQTIAGRVQENAPTPEPDPAVTT